MAGLFQWVQHYLMLHPLLSPLIYTALHILFAVCLIPCSPMAVIAGMLWGKWFGFSISVFAAFLSTCFTFGLSRLFLKNKIYQFLRKRYPRTDWFLEKTKRHGWKFVAAVQLNPSAPGSALGYLFGLTTIGFRVYAFYLLLFMLPLQLLLVFVGDSVSKIIDTTKIPWFFLEIVIMILAVYFFYRMRTKIIERSRLDEQSRL